MKLLIVLSVVLGSFLSVQSRAIAQGIPAFKVLLDCPRFEVSVSTDAEEFKSAFIKKYVTDEKLVEIVSDAKNADIEIHVTDASYDVTKARFIFSIIYHDPKTHEAGTPINLPLLLPYAIDSVQAKGTLVNNAGKSIRLLQEIIADEEKDGHDDTRYENPNAGQVAGPHHQTRAERLANSPIYLSLSADASASQSGSGIYSNTSASGSAFYDFSYLKPRYMIDASGAIASSYSSVPQPDSTGLATGKFTTNSNQSIAFTESMVYTLSRSPTKCKGCWGVVVSNTTVQSKASNVDLLNEAKVGVEWILYPFKSIEKRELIAKIGVDNYLLKLIQPNDRGLMGANYLGLFGSIYYYMVVKKDKISLTFSGDASIIPAYSAYSTYSGSFNATFQVTDPFSISTGGGISYTERSATFPGNPNLSNAFANQARGGDNGWSPRFSLSGNYVIGNRVQKGADKR